MAQKIKGITIEIGGDTTKLDKALSGVNTKAKDLKSELKGVNSLLKLDPSNVTLLKQKQDILNKSIENTRDKLNTLKSTQAQVQQQFNEGKITEEQYRDFQREIVATENKLKSLTQELKNFSSVGAQQIAVVGDKMKNVGDKLESAGKKISVASVGATAALGGIAKNAIDFETAFTGVTKTVDGTEEELAQIKQGLLDLSQATASSTTDIAAVAEAAGQLGVKTENILDFTETMVRLGDSTTLSSEEAATAIAQLYNVMGSDINTVDNFGSALVSLGNNAATTETDILNMATRIGSSGKQVGLTEQEVLALSTTLASVGLEAEGGGSAISAVITKIDKDVALNSDTLKTWADVAGMSVKDFKNLWENDAMSAIQKIVAGMGDASKGGENLNVILDELGVTSLRQTDTMKRLSSASGLMTDMVNLSNEAWEENTSLSEESNKRYQTTAAKMTQLKNQITELCVKLGDILLPILQKIINKISGFVKWLTNLNPAAKKVMVVILALVAALGPLILITAKIISAVGTIMTNAPKLVKLISGIKTAISGLFTLISNHPVIFTITMIVAAIVLLWTKCEWFRNLVTGMFENLKNACKKVIDAIVGFFKGVIDFIKNNWQTILLFIVNPFAGAFKLLYDHCEGFRNFINNFLENVKQFFSNAIENIKNFFSSIPEFIRGIFANAWNNMTSIFGKMADWFRDRLNDVKNVFSTIWNSITGIIRNCWNGILNLFSKGGQIFNGIKDGIVNAFKAIVNAIITGINTVIKIPFDKVNGLLNTIRNVKIPVINKRPFKGLWSQNPLPVPKIPKLRTGGSIEEGQAIVAEAGPEMITMTNGKVRVRPLTSMDRNQVLNTTNNKSNDVHVNVENFYNNRPQDVEGFAQELEFYRRRELDSIGG